MQSQSMTTKSIVFFTILVIIGFISTFIAGFYSYKLLQPIEVNTNKPISTISPTKIPTTLSPQESTTFLPGKHYFDESIAFVTKNKPYKSVLISVTRLENESDYTQNSRMSFFDGSKWTRKLITHSNNDNAIHSDEIIQTWNHKVDSTRVLKETITGTIEINNTDISFETNTLENEISMRSLPGYTKFMSSGSANITIAGEQYEAYVLYTKIYSFNASDIQFYDTALGVTTDWIAFWDIEGNFYHIDSTFIEKPTDIYKSHQIGVIKDTTGSVSKTFQLSINKDTQNPPSVYDITLGDLSSSLNLKRLNQLDKDPSGTYDWYMGMVEGEAQINGKAISGIGLAEYIHD